MALITLWVAVFLSAQGLIYQQVPFTKETLLGKQSSTLLDPSRFSMQQSYSMSFSSNGRENDLSGLYLNRMSYEFDIPLTLQVDIGLFHKPLSLFDGKNELNGGGEKAAYLGVPHARLLWRPSDKFMMSIEYFQSPSSYAKTSPFFFDR